MKFLMNDNIFLKRLNNTEMSLFHVFEVKWIPVFEWGFLIFWQIRKIVCFVVLISNEKIFEVFLLKILMIKFLF